MKKDWRIDARDRIAWYIERIKLADESLQAAYPNMLVDERRRLAVTIAATEGVVDELESITCAIDNIDCGGSSR